MTWSRRAEDQTIQPLPLLPPLLWATMSTLDGILAADRNHYPDWEGEGQGDYGTRKQIFLDSLSSIFYIFAWHAGARGHHR